MKTVTHDFGECELKLTRYAQGGAPAITSTVLSPTTNDIMVGEPGAHYTANLPGLGKTEVAIKNYAEGKGNLQKLIAAGVVAPPHRYERTGFVEIPICKLLWDGQ